MLNQISIKKVSFQYLNDIQKTSKQYCEVKHFNVLKKSQKNHSFIENIQAEIKIDVKPFQLKIRRQSCHCAECGSQTNFQNQQSFNINIVRPKIVIPERIRQISLEKANSFRIGPFKRQSTMFCSARKIGKKEELRSGVLDLANQRGQPKSQNRILDIISMKQSRFNLSQSLKYEPSPTDIISPSPLTDIIKTEPSFRQKRHTVPIGEQLKMNSIKQLRQIFIYPFSKQLKELQTTSKIKYKKCVLRNN